MYKFKKIDGDKFSLIYEKDKEKKQIEFTRSVQMASRLQAIDSEARFKVMMELSRQGFTIDNNPFVIIKQEGNKTIRDESNLNYLIKNETQTMAGKIIIEIIEDTFKLSYDNLFKEIGIDPNDADEIMKFNQEFINIIKNGETSDTKRTPSPIN